MLSVQKCFRGQSSPRGPQVLVSRQRSGERGRAFVAEVVQLEAQGGERAVTVVCGQRRREAHSSIVPQVPGDQPQLLQSGVDLVSVGL